MTRFVDINPGQWVLAFDQPYGPYTREMPEHLELFAHRGGGWDNHQAADIFLMHQIADVKPKTYFDTAGERHPRTHVIAVVDSKEAGLAIRDRLFAIGVDADDAIETEMYRRIERYAARKYAAAQKKVHACLPHFFGRDK